MLVLLLACASHGPAGGAPPPPVDSAGTDSAPTGGGYPGPPSAEVCGESDAFVSQYADTIATWVAQDELAPAPAEPLVLVGSSTARRWEGWARAYADHRPVQRGFGGAQLGEVAKSAADLVLRHGPRGVVVYAGTNDIAVGVDPTVVFDRFRCLRARVAEGAPSATLFFISILPTPARWSQWEDASAVNAAVAALDAADPGLVYVDAATPFLATGSPPDDSLFVADGLHLSEAGYALLDEALRPAVDAVLSPFPEASGPAHPLAPGDRVLVDLGPTDGVDGEPSGDADWLGQAWNDWYPLAGDATVLPGEHLPPLRTATGAPTDVELVITGGFGANGREHGGLLWPDPDRLGDLAVGTATEDFFYAMPDDQTGGVQLRGLDPAAS